MGQKARVPEIRRARKGQTPKNTQKTMADPETQEHSDEDSPEPTEAKEKEVLATKVTGTVKWFNVKSGYGFINRHDTEEDVFIHQSAIVKNNPRKYVRSVGDGDEAGTVDDGSGQSGPPRGRGRGGFRSRGPRRFFRGRFFRGGRGRGGRGGGQGYYDGDMMDGFGGGGMRGGMRGRGRGRGLGRGRGPRGYFRRYYGGPRPQPGEMMAGGPSEVPRRRFRRGGRGRGRGGGSGDDGESEAKSESQQPVENTTAESSAA